jgi:hypothetical protein
LDVDRFGPDVLLECGGTLIVHYVQCQMVVSRFQYGDDFGDHLYHGSIGARWHDPDDDCIKVVDVGNRHALHSFDGAERPGRAPVMSVYMLPIMAFANVAKQNTSCITQIS